MLTGEYTYLDKAVIDFINKVIEKNPDKFDESRFQLWIDNNEIQSKSNPSAFVNKCFLKELNKGTFIKPQEPEIHYIPGCQPIYNAMREKGIKIEPDTTQIIYRINEWLLNNQVLTADELVELNHKVIEYMVEHKDTMTSKDYPDLVRKSKALSGRFVDWVEIGKLANNDIVEWHRLLEELKTEEEESED